MPVHEAAEAGLLALVACAVRPGELRPHDVAAAGRSAWTWRGVDRELNDLLVESSREHRRR